MKAWVNGHVVDEDEPWIRLTDHGFSVGDGVFETLKTIDGEAFALSAHVERLVRSAAGLGLVAPDPGVARSAVLKTCEVNRASLVPEGRIRITYTSGPGPLGSDRGPGPATLAVTAQAAKPWPATTSVALAPWPRNERSALAGLKTTSYGENAVALAWAKERGHSEALLENLRGDLCEGTGSNVFVVLSGLTVTPPLSSGCLAGVTRQLVVNSCGVVERSLPRGVLEEADEVFITSSTRDVHPVARVGDRLLAAPGPVTVECARTFAALAAANLDP
ncbi:MAG: aminotransferase class IV [Candidatus Nanopelagicales bacterium]|nr:aminotransferase class IV [Candidatus Nanopelagicales bacterium]MDZ4250452.1 aminotransferase class IV [Candidatus Nanopelagicales bacterium]